MVTGKLWLVIEEPRWQFRQGYAACVSLIEAKSGAEAIRIREAEEPPARREFKKARAVRAVAGVRERI